MTNYFCVSPYYGLDIDPSSKPNSHCCLLPVDYDIDEIRASITNKQRSPWCEKCWKLEDAGLVSDRQTKNNTMDLLLDKDINFIEQDAVRGGYSVKMLQIATSNLCNGTCITCSPHASSAWAQLEEKHGIKHPRYKTLHDSEYENVNWNELVFLNILAGETFLEPSTWDILNRLITSGNTKCYISIITNGSVFPNPKQLNILSKLENLNLTFSIDGIGNVFNYIRYPLDFNLVTENIDKFRSIIDRFTVSYTVSNLNMIYTQQTEAWFKENNLTYNYNMVTEPSYFSVNALTDSIRQNVLAKYDVKKFLSGQPRELEYFMMKEELARQDKMKNISVHEYMPEFAKVFEI